MDPIAHTLAGATLAETGLRHKTRFATATLIAGANLPDIDGVATFWGQDYSLLVRRGWTHGVLAMLVLPLVLAGLMWLIHRLAPPGKERTEFRPAWVVALAYLGVLSHPLLDWMNTYGVRLLMPFDGTWFYGDTLFIIDPWFWLLMAASVVWARSRTRSSTIAWLVLAAAATALVTFAPMVPLVARIVWWAGVLAIAIARWRGVGEAPTRRAAKLFIAGLVVYIAAMFAMGRIAEQQAAQHVAEVSGEEVELAMASPAPANPFARDLLVRSSTHYHLFEIDWLSQPDDQSVMVEVPGDDPRVKAAWTAPEVQGLKNWIRFPYYEVVEREQGGWRVIIRDLRYVRPDEYESRGIGFATVDLSAELEPIAVGGD